MADGTDTAATPAEPSIAGVLPEVVKGLRHEPALLFGIGAGVVLVAVLGATTNVWLVLIVAAVLVLALAAWVVRGARARVRNTVSSKRAEIGDRAFVGTIEGAHGTIEQVVHADGAKIGEDAHVGEVKS